MSYKKVERTLPFDNEPWGTYFFYFRCKVSFEHKSQITLFDMKYSVESSFDIALYKSLYLHSHGIRLQWSIRKLWQIFSNERQLSRNGKIENDFFDF